VKSILTEQLNWNALLDSERRVLERIASGAPLREILETLVQLIEGQAEGMRCAVLLVDTAQERLRFAAAPNIPEDYKAGIEPFLRIAPNMGSCGTAAFLRKPVYTEDTGVDALWEDCREIAVRNGLRAIWSTPIVSDDNAVLGTFAMYYGEPRLPSAEHIQLIDMATQMARIAIEARSSQDLLRTVFEYAPAGMGIFDLAGNIVRVNPAFSRLVGYTQEQLRGMPITQITHEADYPPYKTVIDELLAGKRERFLIDRRYRRNDGEIIWMHSTIALLRGAADEPRYVVAMIQAAHTRELQLIIDAIPQQIWSGPPNGKLDFCNARWRSELGLSLEDLQGEGWQHILHPDDRERVLLAWHESVVHGTPYEQEERHLMADGHYRQFLCRGVPLRDEEGRILRWYGTNTDIEEAKRADEALRRSQAYLAEAQRLSGTGSFGWNIPSGVIFWSIETFRIFEYEPSTRPTLELVIQRTHPDDVGLVQEAINRALTDRKDWATEHRLLMPDGSTKYVSVVAHAMSNSRGELEYAGAVMDITGTKLALLQNQALKDQLYKENLALKEEVDQASMFEEIVGSSAALNRVLNHVAIVAPTDSTVLIKGETGTGKELIARAIHKRSHRSSRAFIRVNCAAIPAALLASELFGHEKGAFTGATQRRLGRFEMADGGTILLDEVGELPADAQVALLRVIQEREFERVGGNQLVSVDVRILAATNRDLQAAVDAGTFRMDLFYRLNVFPLQIPSLRERVGDISMLLEYFIGRYAAKIGKRIRNIEKRTLKLFQEYHWPGNIRELQNVVERAVILCDGETFSIDETWLQRGSPLQTEQFFPLAASLVDREREMIESALAQSRGRVSGASGAAAKLGLPRSTLESKIRSLRVDKHRFKSG